ncbi:UDP-glycosyltransferase 83A1-like [Canna indica]|uniref:UDP-glycosyltransferase 83A1-like n=1 Tax=Canna indica TaxID=4628 RepID=A0AAQ3L3U7_9LILI|nr:UDP-glycosyltransferase 83A1-like [Canna indica]
MGHHQPHALVVPYPAQGHVIPLLELSYCLADHGFKITFVQTDFNHARVIGAASAPSPEKEGLTDRIRLVSFSDGLAAGEDRNHLWKLSLAIKNAMPSRLEELIRHSNEPGEDKITCMIVDGSLGWALEVARKTGLRSAEFWPTSALTAVMIMAIPKLIQDGIVDEDGVPMKEMFQPCPGLPLMNTANLSWNCFRDAESRKKSFQRLSQNNQMRHIADVVICNSCQEIELPIFTHLPRIRPIGPILTGHRLGKPVGHFWPEDTTCIDWLDEQPTNSVIYVAFGSFTMFDQRQFQELALGLELCNRPFLWAVRPDLGAIHGGAEAYPRGFRERIGSRGRMVSWAPQQKVLAHPAVACFVSHCGWNSTLEGVRNGVPFLCWPYFTDQFLNQSYICDVWRIGLKLVPDEDGIVSKEQIKSKVEELFLDEGMKARALVLKDFAYASVRKGGTSFENVKSFVDALRS